MMQSMNRLLMDAFTFRNACKHYDPSKTVSAEDFNTILEVARLSPSSFGFEPWRLLVLQNEDLRKKLYPIAWGVRNSLNGASHLVLILARKKKDTVYDAGYISHMMTDIQKLPEEIVTQKRAVYQKFQQDDFQLLDSDRSLFDWASKQTYIPLANMLTAAAMLGVDACPMEGFNREAVDRLLVEEELMDAEHFGISVMVSFGYRAKDAQVFPKTRSAAEEIIRWVK